MEVNLSKVILPADQIMILCELLTIMILCELLTVSPLHTLMYY